ncbi:MAG: trigger factor [Pyrinomonadaceae bacterium]
MKSELTDLSPTRKELKIEIELEQIRNAYDRISEQYSKGANVPGFRRGHAPRSVVRTRFKTEIRSDVLRELVPDAVNEAIGQHSLAPLGEPDVQFDNTEAVDRLGEQPISLKVSVEVFPEVKLDSYKNLEAARRVRPITDKDVDKLINALRESSASLQPVEDRPAELGDTVTINVRGKFLDEPAEENIVADDVEVVLGGEGVQPEFNDNLNGVKADDRKTFEVSYPADFTSKGLAGRKVEYEAFVTAVRQKELPDLDDEWARSLGDNLDSLEMLRAKLRGDLELRATAEADQRVRSEVMRKLLESNKFEVPQTLVEQQTSHRLQSVVRDMIARGIDPRNSELNWEGARDELKAQAEDDVRATMLLEQIADEENITVSDEEIEAEIDALSVATQQSKEQVRAALTKEGGERSIAHRLRNRKALDILIQNARVTEEAWSEETDESRSAKPEESSAPT